MIELQEIPELHDPVMVLAFEGWNDAGEAATSTLLHLAQEWEADTVAALDPEDYYDFQVTRPVVQGRPGSRRIDWRTTRVLIASPDELDRDVVLVIGIEPSFRWRSFAEEILQIADKLGVQTVVSIGALLADVAHTRPIPVTATSDDERTIARFDLEASTYEGPTGIVGVVADATRQAGLASISLWAGIPHYAGHVPSPKATFALIRGLERILDSGLPHGTLEEDGQAWERGVNEAAEQDDEIREYVEVLEEAQDTADLPEATGDAIAREFERYLRRRPEDQSDG
ncbi:filament polymerization regulator ParJ [Marihabitans asiaticum]|uniref:Putative ATP-grasp superfamily ATP-dependent carboligase n=1 Tax=Marihabitans asiaticum TaxID=415218 RepID=A0A560W6F8_9MICO|nr:PAC2 family protein [Marihabitans asiaticum]TWD13208.1 putative ATP-grasp superfamily ATP-dependent carboligase [Marihabitans asiaticum]